MKIKKFNSEEEWLEERKGKITGTRLKDLVSKTGGKKIGYYEIIAERIALPPNEENVMDRGHRLELDAIKRFEKETKKKVNSDLVIWCRDDDENIAVSPDGYIGKIAAVEVKCLSSARHIEAWITKEVPNEFKYQVLQYFIVNDKLKFLFFCFYDPRMPVDFFYLIVRKEDVKEEVSQYLELERTVLKEIELLEKDLTF